MNKIVKSELDLLESKELRNELVKRTDILEKVKTLLLLPDIKMATTKQVAYYYEVSDRWIKELLESNRDELVEDGYKVWKASDFNGEVSFPIKNILIEKGKFSIEFSNSQTETFSPRGVALFPRRAILRIGMLLQNSDVAKRVRTALLDIEEKTSTEIKLQDINEEQKLMLEVGMAFASGNTSALMIATTNLMSFKNRHIEKLEESNVALANGILEWEDRSRINFAVRKLAQNAHIQYGQLWNELYRQLKNKYHIDLKARGKQPWIQYVEQEEWNCVIKSFSALCKFYGQEPSEMFCDLVIGEVSANA